MKRKFPALIFEGRLANIVKNIGRIFDSPIYDENKKNLTFL